MCKHKGVRHLSFRNLLLLLPHKAAYADQQLMIDFMLILSTLLKGHSGSKTDPSQVPVLPIMLNVQPGQATYWPLQKKNDAWGSIARCSCDNRVVMGDFVWSYLGFTVHVFTWVYKYSSVLKIKNRSHQIRNISKTLDLGFRGLETSIWPAVNARLLSYL